MTSVRVRIAPSPTGFAHVGTAYTSLFNLAFARKHNGKFILRLEDTDQKRNIEEAEQKIYEGLHWLGINYDEGPDVSGDFGPYRQSERKHLYNPFVDQLLSEGKAYEEDGAVFLKIEEEDVEWEDLVRGKVIFPKEQMKDLVIRKSDGFPTYHFAVVVDDHLMKITHVIRAEDHISNTPRQIQIFKALGFNVPEFAHTPLVRNSDKSKLSKRKNNIEIGWYKEQGYLPEALVNFFSLLGWSHPEGNEIFPVEEFFEKFSLDRIKKTAPVFNIDKLNWMNGEYIKNSSNSDLKLLISDFYKGKYDEEKLKQIIPLVKERISTLKEFESLAGFFFKAPEVDKSLLTKEASVFLNSSYSVLEKLEDWNLENINNLLMEEVDNNNYKTGNFFMSLRIAIAGKKVTPPINESIAILGKEEALARIKKVL